MLWGESIVNVHDDHAESLACLPTPRLVRLKAPYDPATAMVVDVDRQASFAFHAASGDGFFRRLVDGNLDLAWWFVDWDLVYGHTGNSWIWTWRNRECIL